jgi:DNA-binding Lrp family transcriptional regulator
MALKDNVYFSLGEYPHNVLNEESIVVLTWIERSGLTTYAEIAIELGMEENTVNEIVDKLLKNQMIRTCNNFLQPSDKGKYVIDKFQTYLEVINHTFLFDEMSLEEVGLVYHAICLYRKNQYTSYLATLHSLKVWKRLLKVRPAIYSDVNVIDEFDLAIIIYDLKKASQGVSFWNEKQLYFSLIYHDGPVSERPMINRAIQHLKSFNTLVSTKDFGKHPYPLKTFYEYLYCKDHFFASDIQAKIIEALEFGENPNINEVFYLFFEIWKRDFLGNTDKNYRLIETDSPQFPKDNPAEPHLGGAKLNTSLNVAQLALMVRIYREAGIFGNASISETTNFITKFLTTKGNDVSQPSFKTKYYRPSLDTIQSCKYWLKKMQEKLEEFTNQTGVKERVV